MILQVCNMQLALALDKLLRSRCVTLSQHIDNEVIEYQASDKLSHHNIKSSKAVRSRFDVAVGEDLMGM